MREPNEYDDLRDDDEYLDEYDDPDEEFEDDEDDDDVPAPSRVNPYASKPGGTTSGLPGSRPSTFGGGARPTTPGSTSPSGARPFGAGSPASGSGSSGGQSGARPFGGGSTPTSGSGTPSGARPFGAGSPASGSGSSGGQSGARPFGGGSTPASGSGSSGGQSGARPFGGGSTPTSGSSTPSGARPFGAGSPPASGGTPPKKDDKAGSGLGGKIGGLTGGLTSRFGGDKKDDKPATPKKDNKPGGLGGMFNRGQDAKPASRPADKSGGLGGRLGGLFGGKKDSPPPARPGTPTGSSPFSKPSTPSSSASGAKPGSSGAFGSSSRPFGAAGGAATPARPGAAPAKPAKKGLFSFLQRGPKEDKKAAKPRTSKAPKIEQGQGLSLDNKLDILGVGLVLGSLALFFSSLSTTKGALTEAINTFLGNAFGWGAIAIPLAMLAVGVWLIARHFGEDAPVIERMRVIGIIVLFLGILIILQYVDSFSYTGVTNLAQLRVLLELSWTFGQGGGWLGAQLYFLLVSNVTELGAFFVTIGWVLVGIMLTADVSFYQLAVFIISAGRSFNDARARRAQARAAEQAAKALAAAPPTPQISVTAPPPEQLPAGAQAALPTPPAAAAPALPEPPRDIPITIGGRTITAANSELSPVELRPAAGVPAAARSPAADSLPEEAAARGGLGARLRGAVPSFALPGSSKATEPAKPAETAAAVSKPAEAAGIRSRLFGGKPAAPPAEAQAETPVAAANDIPKPAAASLAASSPPPASAASPAAPVNPDRWKRPGGETTPSTPTPAVPGREAAEPAARLGDLVRPAAKPPEPARPADQPAARLGDLVRPAPTPPTRQTGTFGAAKPADSRPLGGEPATPLAGAIPAARPPDDDFIEDDEDELTESEELRRLPPAKPKGYVEPPPKADESKSRFGVSVFGSPRPGAAPASPPKPEPDEEEKPSLQERMERLNAIRSGTLSPAEDGDKVTAAAAPRPFGAKPDEKPAAPAPRPAAPVDGQGAKTVPPAGDGLKSGDTTTPPWDTGVKPAASLKPDGHTTPPPRSESEAVKADVPRPTGAQPFSRPPVTSPFGKPADDQSKAAPAGGLKPAGSSPSRQEPERRSVFTPPTTPPGAVTPVIQHAGAQSVPQAAQPAPMPTVSSTKRRKDYRLPDMAALLRPGSEQDFDRDSLLARARVIEDTLNSFGAPGKVVEVNTGPVITQFAVEPGYLMSRGGKNSRVKVSAIAQLDKDLQLALGAKSIRIEAPVPGKGYVGIEVPNEQPALVSLRDVMDSEEFRKIKSPLAIALGQSVDGTPVAADLGTMPHLLIAGTTGSGKSVCVNAIIASLLLLNQPDRLKFIMVDPKRVELTGYNGIPHLVAPVVVELERIVGVLKWVTREMDERYKRFSNAGARNIEDFNNHLPANEEIMPYIVVIIDELADLMMLAPDETERVITRIAALARATGIHLVIATQRPSVDVVTGLIKANFPARIAFAVASSVDSRVIIDQPGADRLLGRGDMLYMSGDSPAPLRLQGVFVGDSEINNINRFWKSQVAEDEIAAKPITQLVLDHTIAEPPRPVMPSNERQQMQQAFWDRDDDERKPGQRGFMGLGAEADDDEAASDGEDELYDEAVEMVRRLNKASVSLLQRRLRIGYTRAARLIDIMEERGVVGPAESGSKPREVLPLKG